MGLASSRVFRVVAPTADLALPAANTTTGVTQINVTHRSIDVTFFPAPGQRVDESSLTGAVTLSGAGAAGVAITGWSLGRGTTYAFTFSGNFQAGDVYVTIGGCATPRAPSRRRRRSTSSSTSRAPPSPTRWRRSAATSLARAATST